MNTELKEKMQKAAREYASPFDIVEEIDMRCNVLDAFYAGNEAMYTAIKEQIERCVEPEVSERSRTVETWVSVEDELPEEYTTVLLKTDTDCISTGQLRDELFWIDCEELQQCIVDYWRRIEL